MSVPELAVRDVTVRFAGVVALDDVSFTVAPGAIHAVIGPNGAGKSTCFNVISGVYRATSGQVDYGEHRLSSMRPDRVADAGVARTFQNIAVGQHTSVIDNIMVGRHHLTRSGFLTSALSWPGARREERRHRERAAELADFVGLGGHLGTPAGVLSYGDQKRLELARALAMEPSLLMLDEPVAGMNAVETEVMAEVILAVRDAMDLSILLVEHDMGMVMSLADHVTVLDFGRRIADGPPQAVQSDPEVIRAYLGGAEELAARYHAEDLDLGAAGPRPGQDDAPDPHHHDRTEDAR